MSPDLEKKLYEKYPKIFRQKDLSMQETCMCWGVDTGDGWYTLIDSLCQSLQSMTDYNKHLPERFPQIEATQVKEKYGTLRFYTTASSDHQEGMIHFAETMSGKTCDVCGNPGKLRNNGWMQTRCEEHKGTQWHELEESESTEESIK